MPSSDKFLVGRMAYIVATPFYSGILKHLKLQKYATQPFHHNISFSKTANVFFSFLGFTQVRLRQIETVSFRGAFFLRV